MADTGLGRCGDVLVVPTRVVRVYTWRSTANVWLASVTVLPTAPKSMDARCVPSVALGRRARGGAAGPAVFTITLPNLSRGAVGSSMEDELSIRSWRCISRNFVRTKFCNNRLRSTVVV